MRYMDCGNYIKRNGHCATISCETKGQKNWWKKSKEQIVDGMEKQGKRYVSVDG